MTITLLRSRRLPTCRSAARWIWLGERRRRQWVCLNSWGIRSSTSRSRSIWVISMWTSRRISSISWESMRWSPCSLNMIRHSFCWTTPGSQRQLRCSETMIISCMSQLSTSEISKCCKRCSPLDVRYSCASFSLRLLFSSHSMPMNSHLDPSRGWSPK